MLPFRDGTPDDFSALRSLLDAAGYTPEAVCERTGAGRIEEFKSLLQGRDSDPNVHDALDTLIRLFLDGLPVPTPAVDTLLAGSGLEALKRLGLLAEHPRQSGHYAASVLLYPTRGVYVVSDLDENAPGLLSEDELEPPDFVFSAITTLTGTFLDQLPTATRGRFLELCAGTGIAALMAACSGCEAWAADITERSTAFARFNAQLNGLENFTAVQGDLYDPVQGMSFDRIVAHPPYVPATETRMIYRDGGEDGEGVIRRILAGLPDHLAEGGRFYLTCVASDREGAPLEQRIREMIGTQERMFDLLLVSHYALHPPEFYSRLAASGRIGFDIAEERIALFRELKAERIVYASMILQRHDAPRQPFTVRRERVEASASAEAEWMLDWMTRGATDPDLLASLLDARPRLSPYARLEVTHRVEDNGWKYEASRVQLEYPFVRTVEISTNGATLLTLFDGGETVRRILNRLRSSGAIPAEATDESFAEFVRELVGEGVLRLEDAPVASPMLGNALVAPI